MREIRIKIPDFKFPKLKMKGIENIPEVNINKSMGFEAEKQIKIPVSATIQKATNNSVMQSTRKSPSNQQYSVCSVCHKRNVAGAKICINCGNKIN